MHTHDHIVLKRIARTLEDRIKPAITTHVGALEVRAYRMPGEPRPAAELRDDLPTLVEPVSLPLRWGRAWETWWFQLEGRIPEHSGETPLRLSVDLGFHDDWPGNQCEGLLYDAQFRPLKAINSRNREWVIEPEKSADGTVTFWIEAAANPDVLSPGFSPTVQGDVLTRTPDQLYTLRAAEFVTRHDEVFQLFHDVDVARDLALNLPESSERRAVLIHTLDRALDHLDPRDIPQTAHAAREILRPALEAPAQASALRVSAIGHAHIDSAWLWPVRETIRKVARTFSNVANLAAEYPDFTFTATSAQQYAWLKDTQPEIFERVRAAIAAGQWFPSGGMWVESDVMMPGGEALFRQFDFGTRFFEDEFNLRSSTLWLPDSFGYPASLPQIARQMGLTGFLTQKISWSQHNQLPHSTMWWEGIDGSRIFTHFPPVNCYDSELSAEEYTLARTNYREKGAASMQVIPYGYGDGGGGPTEQMVERGRRLRDLEGAPRMEFSDPDSFFEAARAEYPNAPLYSGELYLEFHRGIYTSQRDMKRGNRSSEHALRSLELAWALALTRTTDQVPAGEYPQGEVDSLWHTVLLNQFHDILPGSSIAWVHRVAREEYARIGEEARRLTASAGAGDIASIFNAATHARREVVNVDGTDVFVDVPGLSTTALETAQATPTDAVELVHESGGVRIHNGLFEVVFDEQARIVSLVDTHEGRELAIPGHEIAQLRTYRDTPNEFDAWDIERHYRNEGMEIPVPAASLTVEHGSPLRATVRRERTLGDSTLIERFSVTAESPVFACELEVDWHEKETLLKTVVPVALHARESASEIAFGHVRRPIHENTSWDFSKYEFPAHRWLLVEEPSYGLAVVNDSIYGHSVWRVPSDGLGHSGGGCAIELSLLRAPLYPDPNTDQGAHRMTFGIHVGATVQSASRSGYAMNLPLTLTDAPEASLLEVLEGTAVVESARPTRDDSGDIIIRLYESDGSRSRTRVRPAFACARVWEVDPLERDLTPEQWDPRIDTALAPGEAFDLDLMPFTIMTIRLRPEN